MEKYNIALLPLVEGNKFISLANKFSSVADKYILSDESLPHVTICQFFAEEFEVNEIWQQVSTLLKDPLNLTFNEFSCITVGETDWVSLLPDNIEILEGLNRDVIAILKNPVKTTFNYYDPHLTLVNSKEKKYEAVFNQVYLDYQPLQDAFILAIGKTDVLGQFNKTLLGGALF